MESNMYYKLLLKTAFSCMACDGDIDKREIKLIKLLQKENKIFGDINIDKEMDQLIIAINRDGHEFMRNYFDELTNVALNESEELRLIEVAIETIKADERVEYSEIKFFKVIRSKLKIDSDKILEKHPDFEDYLEQDIISDAYLARLQDDFFDTHISQEFVLSSDIEDDIILKNLKNRNNK